MLWIILAISLCTYMFWKVRKAQSYWKERGVPQGKPTFLIGDGYDYLSGQISAADSVQKMYKEFSGHRYRGGYQFLKPMLMIMDPELIKQITVKDFDHFTDHREIFPEGSEPLWSRNLFALTGVKWRNMRATLSPCFTSSKMKLMYNLISDCAEKYVNKLSKEEKEYEIKDIFTRFTNDVIATCAFGVDVDSFGDSNSEFYNYGKDLTNMSGSSKMLKMMLFLSVKGFAQKIGLTMFPEKPKNFFSKLILDAINKREKSNIVRPDLIHILIEAKKGRSKTDDPEIEETGFAAIKEHHLTTAKNEGLTDADILAQAFVFFFAGFDSVASLLCFMSYELAINPEIQEKLRDEVNETLNECNGKVTYEALMKMKYMDMVVSETLRKWPIAFTIDRKCTKPYTIQPTKLEEKPVDIPKDFFIAIPIFSIHRDPKYYPDPERFDPERFSDENKSNIKSSTYMPFGTGPRACIGSRFALLEAKILAFHMLSKLEITTSPKTPIPMKLGLRSFTLTADPGFYVTLKPRS